MQYLSLVVRLQLPVKMVRCGQHATLAVQLAAQLAATSAPHWGRKSNSSVAVPTIAEEDVSAGAYSGFTSPRPADGVIRTQSAATAHVATSLLMQEMQSVSSPVQGTTPLAETTAAHSRPAVTQNIPSAANGSQAAEDRSKEQPAANSNKAPHQHLSRAAETPAIYASDVFREQQPCRRPAKPLQGYTSVPPDNATAASPGDGSVQEPREGSTYIEGQVGSSCVKLAQLHPPGSMAAQSHMLSDSAGAPPHTSILNA